MSGYLQNLAARALGKADTLKPRLAPLLGPASFDTAWQAPAYEPDPARLHEAAPTSTVQAPAARPAGEPPTARPPENFVKGGAANAVGPVISISPSIAAPVATPFSPPVISISPSIAASSAPPSFPPQVGMSPAAAPSAAKLATPARLAEWAEARAPAFRGVSPAEVVIRSSPPATPQLQTGHPAAAAPEPTVHVMIGRVEVRAIPADSPAAPRPSRPAARLSELERFRRRDTRGGGG